MVHAPPAVVAREAEGAVLAAAVASVHRVAVLAALEAWDLTVLAEPRENPRPS